ncbi:uncharacterized protein BDV14DRAFT_179045 [Aspergillus stella-maris]|uniref:uncharacterized protein n=1 Tax=Aspergillus stella-maris TaxID=1810926 RepID=UPI003CCE4DE7
MSTILPQTMGRSLVPLPLKTSANHHDPLLHVERQAKHIQRNLQYLIDAQSEGLLAGLGARPEESVLNESHTYLSGPGSSKGASPVPVRQPPGKKIGLRSARQGIFMSMYDLMKLREEEQEILSLKQDEMGSGLGQIETFTTKRSGLEKAISAINDDRETQRSRELREEGSQLEAQIHEMENTLAQMKAKHRHVVQELAQIENTVEAKLSSYKASLSLLESDVRKFLANPPVKPPARSTIHDSFYSLKPSRRTLEMADEHWRKEQTEVHQRQEEVDAEIKALDEGGGVWKQVVEDISGFEKRLRTTMRRSMQTQSQLLQQDSPSQIDTARGIMEDLEHTTNLFEQHLEHVEERKWNLLVCCISAELQALREARELLLGAFGVTDEDIDPSASSLNGSQAQDMSLNGVTPADPLGAVHEDDDDHHLEHSEPPADLLQDVDDHDHDHSHEDEAANSHLHALDDDDPDPAWLLPEN